jgi:organic radical activating enzyme
MLKTETLYHGGIMVNYQCNASCRHCLYACSPARKPGYVNEEMAEKICRLLREGDCRSVHIGGGEPFLNFDGLLTMIRALNKSNITLEYIETNAFWAADLENGDSKKLSAKEMIKQLLAENANTLCISLDPFHAEYVPYGAALNLAKLCEKTGMRYFLWKQEFLSTLSRLDPKKTHSREEMEKALSANYINKTAKHYGITYGGRAVNIEREYSTLYPAEKFAGDTSPCRNLLSTGHFHVDKDAYFIPPGCTGILIPLSEAVYGISAGKYPAFEALYHGGISSLFKLAIQHGFSPDNAGYPSKCNLCFFIRQFLCDKGFPELDGDHYLTTKF